MTACSVNTSFLMLSLVIAGGVAVTVEECSEGKYFDVDTAKCETCDNMCLDHVSSTLRCLDACSNYFLSPGRS